ncbi:metallophosphoesterase [Calditrichota bacterium]
MKGFIIFITLVLLIYGGTNFYIYQRVIGAAQMQGALALAIKLLLLALILAYPVSRFLDITHGLGKFLYWTGSFWLGIMSYGLLAVVVVDLFRLSDLITGWYPAWLIQNRLLVSRMVVVGFSTLILLLIAGGFARQRNVVVREHTITLPHLPDNFTGYRFAVFADTHLGSINGEKWLSRLVEQINGVDAKAVLIIGDLYDEKAESVKWSAELLRTVQPPDGVWAVTGNHEFYEGIDKATALMKESGLNVLRNKTAIIGDFFLVGLDDIAANRSFGIPLVPIAELTAKNERNLPVILLHHTPVRYKEAVEAGVDLWFSGHTHGGQMFPFGWLAKLSYGVGQGWTQMGSMQLFVTDGAGTWGPPVRVGTTPELVVINIEKES